MKKGVLYFLFFLIAHPVCYSQDNLFARFTTRENKEKIHRNLVNHTIQYNLSLPLNDTTEARWEDAFGALELLLLRNSTIDKKITEAIINISQRSPGFQRSLLELAYTNYPSEFRSQVSALLQETIDVKNFAMCAEYLLRNADSSTIEMVEETFVRKFPDLEADPILIMLAEHISNIKFPEPSFIENKYFPDILSKDFLPGHVILYSFQRKDRDYPGMVLIRKREGKFIRDEFNNLFSVPQLARSISGLPAYLTNGNTPQGIFKMQGFGVSTSIFIGPSPNIQLSMPGESTIRNFLGDGSIVDSTWTKEQYEKLIPRRLQNYTALYQSYYAGLAGRTEIISHGTTIDPEYYKGKPYYPHTPTQGCLSTKEIWDGRRMESNQKILIEALLRAGGATGYCVVIELDDQKKPVSIKELLPFINQ